MPLAVSEDVELRQSSVRFPARTEYSAELSLAEGLRSEIIVVYDRRATDGKLPVNPNKPTS